MSSSLRHVVLFAFTPEADPSQVVAHFRALKGSIPVIDGLESGHDVSPEGLGQGFTHVFTLTFATETARDAYLVHFEHQAFVDWVKPFLAKSLVVDYWAEPAH